MPIRLGIAPDLYCEPLLAGLAPGGSFAVTRAVTLQNAAALREDRLDAALLSPIDYARDGSLYRVVPGVAVSSGQATGTVIVQMRADRARVATLAVDPSSTSEVVLARLILAEEFESIPRIVPVPPSTAEQMLHHADAALLIGDAALRAASSARITIDLVEEWYELSGLPYVHGFWCGREGRLAAEDQRLLAEAPARFASTPASDPAYARTGLSGAFRAEYLDAFSYELDDAILGALREFLSYAYYHGILPDVPEINFYSSAGEEEEDQN